MRKVIITAIIILFIVTIAYVFIKTSNTGDINEISKLSILAQLIYTFITAILVFLTYWVLVETKSQKNLGVRPYIIAEEFEFWDVSEEYEQFELDFYIRNEGIGIVLNILVEVKNLNDNDMIYTENYTRLAPAKDIVYELQDIGQQLFKISHDKENISRCLSGADIIEVEIPLEKDKSQYLNIKTTITYEDIFKKTYRNTFTIKLTDDFDNDEGYECVETFEELSRRHKTRSKSN